MLRLQLTLKPKKENVMAKDQKTPVTINDKEYFVEDLTQEAKMLIDHVNDFDRKLSVNQFTANSLNLGKTKALELLTEAVENPKEAAE
jgi:hypothetical protein